MAGCYLLAGLVLSHLVLQVSATDKVLVLYSSKLESIAESSFNLDHLEIGSGDNCGKLFPENTTLLFRDIDASSCDGQARNVVSIFIEEVFMNSSNTGSVVAIVGPSCTDSAYAIARLANRREISMVHLHTSPLPAPLAAPLSNSFGILSPVELLADASTALIQYADWSRVMALYQDTDTEMNYIFNHLRQQLTSIGRSDTLEYSSITHNEHVRLKFALSNFATRIVFVMLGRDLARKVLCEAYHLGAVYPHYQLVVFRSTLGDLLPQDNIYTESCNQWCTRDNMMVALKQAILIGFDKGTKEAVYDRAIDLLLQGFQLSRKSGDLSLHGAISHLERRISKQILIEQMDTASNGSAVFAYNRKTHSLSKYGEAAAEFKIVPSNFTTISDTVGSEVFYITLAIFTIQLSLTVLTQVLTVYYREKKAIKATSPNIQQLAYIGLYLIIFTNIVYTVQKGIQMDNKIYAHLCSVFNVFSSIGYTVLLGSLSVKAWRLYRIFNHYMNPGDLLSDKILCLIILGLALVDGVICILWVTVGNPVREKYPLKVDFEKRVQIVYNVCRTQYYYVWYTSSNIYHLILLAVAAFFSAKVKSTAPKYHRELRRNEVILLTYLVSVLIMTGYPSYFLAHFVTKNILLEYTMVILGLSSFACLYLVLFFASPLYRAAREDEKPSRNPR